MVELYVEFVWINDSITNTLRLASGRRSFFVHNMTSDIVYR